MLAHVRRWHTDTIAISGKPVAAPRYGLPAFVRRAVVQLRKLPSGLCAIGVGPLARVHAVVRHGHANTFAASEYAASKWWACVRFYAGVAVV